MLKASVSEELIINSDWLLVLDADEFMSINHPSGTLDGLLDDLMAIDAHAYGDYVANFWVLRYSYLDA
jgi:hypothetical protein